MIDKASMKNISRTIQIQIDNSNKSNKLVDLGNNQQSFKSILKSKTHGTNGAKSSSDNLRGGSAKSLIDR